MYLKLSAKNTGKYTKKFKGQKRICANSGRTGYEKEMVKKNGFWYMKSEVDKDENNDS